MAPPAFIMQEAQIGIYLCQFIFFFFFMQELDFVGTSFNSCRRMGIVIGETGRKLRITSRSSDVHWPSEEQSPYLAGELSIKIAAAATLWGRPNLEDLHTIGRGRGGLI